VEVFWAVENEHRSREQTGDVHAKVDDNNVVVRVHGVVEDILGSATLVKEEREAHLRLQRTILWQWRKSTALCLVLPLARTQSKSSLPVASSEVR